METWYVLDESVSPAQPQGPWSDDQLREMVASGRVTASTRIARAGGAAWTEASLEPAFAGLFRSVPPQSPVFVAPLAPTSGYEANFSFGTCCAASFVAFRQHWKSLALISLVAFGGLLVVLIPQIIGAAYDASGPRQEPSTVGIVGNCLTTLLFVLLGAPFLNGCIYAASQAIRGSMRLGDTLIGLRNYGQTLLGTLLLVAVYIGCTIIAMIPAYALMFAALAIVFATAGAGFVVAPFIMGIGILLYFWVFVALAAYSLTRLLFVPLIAIDPAMGSMGIGRAVSYSWKATKGRGWAMVWLFFVFGMLAGLSAFLLLIGYVLIGLPLLLALMAVMHEQLNRRGSAAPAPVVA